MKRGTFGSFFEFEFRRLWTGRNISVMLVIWGICMYFIWVGIQQYNDIDKSKQEFQTIESTKVQMFQNYDQYGGYGFRLYFMPSVLSVFSNNSNLFTELNAQIEVGEKLRIYDSYKGKKVFALKPGRWLDFSGIVFIFGSLMALFYSFDAFKRHEYLRFLSSIYGYRRVFRFMWGARVILLCLYFLILFSSALSLILISGLKLGTKDIIYLLVSLAVTLLMLVSFFSLGIFAVARKKYKALVMIVIWVFFVYFLPVFINIIFEYSAKGIESNYQDESNKLKILMDFERSAMEKAKLEKLAPIESFLRSTPELKKLKFLLDEEERVRHQIEKVEKAEKRKPGELDELKRFRNWLSTQLEEEKETVGQLDVFRKWLSNRKMTFFMGIGKTEGEKKELLQKALNIVTELERDIGFVKGEWPVKLLDEYHRLKTNRDDVADRLLARYDTTAGSKIEKLEADLQSKIRSRIGTFYAVSILTPSTFYLALNNEISSRGYRNLVDFHKYAEETKKKFIKFHTEKRRKEFEAKRSGDRVKVESFIKGDENIFTRRIHWHWVFSLGIAFLLVWNLALWRFTIKKFEKFLFAVPREVVPGLDQLNLDESNPGEVNVVLSNDPDVCKRLYSTMSKRGLESHNDGTPVEENNAIEFIYLFRPTDLPKEVKAKDFFDFLSCLNESGGNDVEKRWDKIAETPGLKKHGRKNLYFNDLKEAERGLIFLEGVGAQTEVNRRYLIYDFARGLPMNEVKKFVDWLEDQKNKGASVLYLTNDVFLARKIADYISFLKKDVTEKDISFFL